MIYSKIFGINDENDATAYIVSFVKSLEHCFKKEHDYNYYEISGMLFQDDNAIYALNLVQLPNVPLYYLIHMLKRNNIDVNNFLYFSETDDRKIFFRDILRSASDQTLKDIYYLQIRSESFKLHEHDSDLKSLFKEYNLCSYDLNVYLTKEYIAEIILQKGIAYDFNNFLNGDDE